VTKFPFQSGGSGKGWVITLNVNRFPEKVGLVERKGKAGHL
jgi:hypothetical protein